MNESSTVSVTSIDQAQNLYVESERLLSNFERKSTQALQLRTKILVLCEQYQNVRRSLTKDSHTLERNMENLRQFYDSQLFTESTNLDLAEVGQKMSTVALGQKDTIRALQESFQPISVYFGQQKQI